MLTCYFSGVFVCLWFLLIVPVNIVSCRVTLYPSGSQPELMKFPLQRGISWAQGWRSHATWSLDDIWVALSEFNTTGERSWFGQLLSSSTMPWPPVTGGGQHLLPQHFPKLFTGNPIICFRGRQSMWRSLWHTLAEGWNVVCITRHAVTKTALGVIQLWFDYFVASFFKALGNVNVNYLKIPEKYRRPHKRPSRATYAPRAACLRPLI